MEPTIYKYILRYSWRDQILLLILTLLSFPFLYISLEIPKTIVNDAIGSSDFPRHVWHFQFEQIEYLAIYCVIFLGLVGVNGGFKYYINVFKGQLGERMLRRLRYQLFGRLLHFPPERFRVTSQGELIAMITAETEPLGGFIGDALAQPLFQGGTLLTILTFMFVQDPMLGLAAIALYPLQMYIIPRLQRQVNRLAKQRVQTVRSLAARIGETVTGIDDVRINDTHEWHRAEFAAWAGKIYHIRYDIYRKKFFIKFLNNFIAQLTPFFFFSIGGYLVIRGDITFGSLVAVLAAYKDLSSPWKELLDWYQQREDTRVKYQVLFEQFELGGAGSIVDEVATDAPVGRLAGPLIARSLTVEEEGGIKTIDQVSFELAPGEVIAVTGSGPAAEAVGRLLARLIIPTFGTITIGGEPLGRLPAAVVGRRIGYVGGTGSLANGTILDNLLYPFKHRPVAAGNIGDASHEHVESVASGNTTSRPEDEWIDAADLGVASRDEVPNRIIASLDCLGLLNDVFALGLGGSIDVDKDPDSAALVLMARGALHARLAEAALRDLVEPFDPDRYNLNLSAGENLLFGVPCCATFDLSNLAAHPFVRNVLDDTGLTEPLLAVGEETARILVEIFADLPPGDELAVRFSFVGQDTLVELQSILRRLQTISRDRLDDAERTQLLSLPLNLVCARHRLAMLDETLQQRILAARHVFAATLPADLQGTIAFFDPGIYTRGASVQDNILFGRIAYGRAHSRPQVEALIAEVVDAVGLRQTITDLGLGFAVGIGGSRLNQSQRQRLLIARALLKDADLLIFNQCGGNVDRAVQDAVLRQVARRKLAVGAVWIGEFPDSGHYFDRVLSFDGVRLAMEEPRADITVLRGQGGNPASAPMASSAAAVEGRN